MSKGCNTQNRGPRSKPVPLLVQAGWRVLQRGEITTREPIMREVTTQWLPIACGYIRKENDHQSHLCDGCENEVIA